MSGRLVDKVTIFGAGHVGSTAAFYLALQTAVEIVLIDIEEGLAHGLAMDIGQALPYTGSEATVTGGSDPAMAEGSDLIVITAGTPRKPGMSRLDLTAKNLPVIESIAKSVAEYSPDSVVMVVTNPVDEMTYLTYERGGFQKSRVMGMAGVLDTSRFFYFLDNIGGYKPRDVNAMVLGTHGDDMVPLPDWSKAGGSSLREAVDGERLNSVIERTRNGGAEIIGHLGSGSAYYAPAVSIGVTALSILGDTGRVLPVSAYLEGQYGINGIFLGVPSRLGKAGILEVVELPLSDMERKMLAGAADGVESRLRELRSLTDHESP